MGARLNRALSRIPDEFKDQPMYRQLMTAIVNRMEETDTIIADLATMRWIDSAEGVWLDTVGEIIGIPRFYEPLTEGIFTYNGFGPELMIDGDMEAPDASAYTSISSAVLTKVPDFENPNDQVLDVAYGGSPTPQARQFPPGLTVGKTYEVSCRARNASGLANVKPRIQISSDLDEGTDSADWQVLGFSATVTGTNILLRATNLSAAGSVQFDDVSIKEVPPGDSDLGYSGLPAPGAGGIYNSVNGLFSDTLIDDDTYRRYIKAKAKATGTPGTLADIYTFIKEAFVVESIVTTSGTRQTTVQLVDPLTQGQKLQLKRWAPVSAAVSIRILDP